MKTISLFILGLTAVFAAGGCSREVDTETAPTVAIQETPRLPAPQDAAGQDGLHDTQVFTNEIEGYRLLYPATFNVVVYENAMCLTPSDESFGTCHVANALVEASDAGGRDVDQIADEVAASSNPDIEVKRTSLMISGEEAVLLDDIHTYDVLRKVVVVHNDRAYILTFVPWVETIEGFSMLQNLYAMVIDSFRFYEPPAGHTPAEPDPDTVAGFIPPAQPDITTMTARSLTATSPDAMWTAEALLAFFIGETSSFDYTRLTLTRDFEGLLQWIPYQEWSEAGLGDSHLSDFYWSSDGRYVYFTHQGVGHPCGGVFVTNLRQVDLSDGSLREIPLTGLGLGIITISPDARALVHRVPEGFSLRGLAHGESRLIPYEWPPEDDVQVGSYAWSPDGEKIAFTISHSSCVVSEDIELPWTSIRILNLATGEVQTLKDREPGIFAVTGWPDPRALQVFHSGNRLLMRIDSGELLPDPAPLAAEVLEDFLNSLAWGGTDFGHYTYERAANLYGGDYQVLVEMNPEIDPSDQAALLRSACEFNGFQCLRLLEVVSSSTRLQPDGIFQIELTVQLMDNYGALFRMGPCCGEEASGPPQSKFDFTIRRLFDGTMQVLELPPYMP